MPGDLDIEIERQGSGGHSICLRRDSTGSVAIAAAARTASDCLKAIGVEKDQPVLVLIGGAGAMDDLNRSNDAQNHDEAGIAQLRRAMDLAISQSVVQASAVVLTGGTARGVMRLAGEYLGGRGLTALIGVAPRAKVTAESATPNPGEGRTPLDSGHSGFVLTPGEHWGAESEMLFELAEHIAGESQQGVVVLANGGEIARQEASRFLEAGWPVVTLAGTGRAADELALAWEARNWSRLRRCRRRAAIRRWGDLSHAQVEIWPIDGEELGLSRHLAWHMSASQLLKNALSSQAAYDLASNAGRTLTRTIQWIGGLLAGLLTVGSLVEGLYLHSEALKWVLVVMPVLVALNWSVVDFIVPRRNWMAMRATAQAIERAVYRYRARLPPAIDGTDADERVSDDADHRLQVELSSIREGITKSGIRNIAAAPVGRPPSLSNAYDELSPLTVREYLAIRVDGQLTYYRDAARGLDRKQLLSLAAGAGFAAVATWAASELAAATWVPVLVLAGAALVIAQQRARWQDRAALFSTAITDLQGIRDMQWRGEAGPDLLDLVMRVEAALEREGVAWAQNMKQMAVPIPPSFG